GEGDPLGLFTVAQRGVHQADVALRGGVAHAARVLRPSKKERILANSAACHNPLSQDEGWQHSFGLSPTANWRSTCSIRRRQFKPRNDQGILRALFWFTR